MNGGKYGISIFACSSVVDVDIRDDVVAIPETLQEAKSLRSLRDTIAAGLAE